MLFPLSLNRIVQLQLVCSVPGQVSINDRYFQVATTAGPFLTDSGDGVVALDLAISPFLIPLLYNGATYRGASLRRITGPTPLEQPTITTASTNIGTAGATALPKQTCGLISWGTGVVGRKWRGRSYLPFPASADDAGDGVPTIGYRLRLAALAAAVIGPITVTSGANTCTLVPVMYNGATGTSFFIDEFTARQSWATQRRRGDFGRLNSPPF